MPRSNFDIALQFLSIAKQIAEEAMDHESRIEREAYLETAADYAKQAADLLARHIFRYASY